MNKTKLLIAISVLQKENIKTADGDYRLGYTRALFDVLQSVDLIIKENI